MTDTAASATSFATLFDGVVGNIATVVRGKRDSIEFAVMAFYGALEQVLTGWIFGLLDQGDEAYEGAKAHVVETICRGLAA